MVCQVVGEGEDKEQSAENVGKHRVRENRSQNRRERKRSENGRRELSVLKCYRTSFNHWLNEVNREVPPGHDIT